MEKRSLDGFLSAGRGQHRRNAVMSSVQQEGGVLPAAGERTSESVFSVLCGLVQEELRHSVQAALHSGDSRGPLIRLAEEVQTMTDRVHIHVSDVKTKIQGLVEQAVRSAVTETLNGASADGRDTRLDGETESARAAQPMQSSFRGGGSGNAEPPYPRTFAGASGTPHEEPAHPADDVQSTDHYLARGAHGAVHMSSTETDAHIWNGTVRLIVKANGHMHAAVRFLARLRRTDQLRLLQVGGDPGQGDIEVVIGLRESMNLEQILLEMAEVLMVKVPGDNGSHRTDGPESAWIVEVTDPLSAVPVER